VKYIETLNNKPVAWGQMLHSHDAGPQIGGFTIGFNTESKVSLDFVTVRGSGHMVPKDAPQRALHVIKRLLLDGKKLTPLLPNDWWKSSWEQFYGTTTAGIFTKWVKLAMGEEFTNN